MKSIDIYKRIADEEYVNILSHEFIVDSARMKNELENSSALFAMPAPLSPSPPVPARPLRAIAAAMLKSAESDLIQANDLVVAAGAKLKTLNEMVPLREGALDVWLDLSGVNGNLGRLIVNGEITRLEPAL